MTLGRWYLFPKLQILQLYSRGKAFYSAGWLQELEKKSIRTAGCSELCLCPAALSAPWGQGSGLIHLCPCCSIEHMPDTQGVPRKWVLSDQKKRSDQADGWHSLALETGEKKKWFRNGVSGLRVPISSFRVQAGIAWSHSSLRLTTRGWNLPPLITSFPGNRSSPCLPRSS